MPRSLTILLMMLALAGPAWPQDESSSGVAGEPVSDDTADSADEEIAAEAAPAEDVATDEDEGIAAEAAPTDDVATDDDEGIAAESAPADDEPAAEPEIVDPAFEDTDLDVQTYEEDDDNFVPSEEIPADEPIPFPSNI